MHKLLILDGAMGTMLQAAGMKAGEHPEVFGFDNPDIVKNIHLKYIESGSNVIYTNTFGANAHKLEGCKIDVDTAVKTAIKSAKEAIAESKRDVKIALDIGPIGELLEPLGVLRFEDAYEIYKEMVVAGEKYGADAIIFETFTDLYDVRAGVLAAKENTKLPVWVTMTYETTGRTFTGTKIESMAVTLEGLGVDAIGFNCSLGPKEILPLAKKLKEWTNLPIIIKPNAGLPNPSTGEYDLLATDFAKLMAEFGEIGIEYAGGCCGTSPEFISELKAEFEKREFSEIKSAKAKTGICSGNEMVELNGVRVVGERLNPTGKKRFQEALLNHEMEYICKVAIEEEESGADILDINVGVPGGDEVALMIEAVKAVQSVVNIPLQIDSSNPEAIEAGLRVYNGRAIVNSVNAEDERLDLILPIVKKYAAAVIGL
ncbi:MAG: homocysteine S-methyltransferase family protein, partial [Lachnoanaerobaculum sp.]|nr:homocysteine S-methyltransferase family protein [Lachnoanaerobaculum sp.]